VSNTIRLTEPDVNALMTGGWTGLRLERGPNATNIAAFQLVVLLPYVTNQTVYTYADATGAASDWYRTAHYGPGGIGVFSPAWPVLPAPITADGGARRSLKNCRRMLARRSGSLQVVTTTSDGNTAGSTIISTGLATVLDANRYRAWYAMPTDGVSNGQIRTIGDTALNPTDGTLNISPPYRSQIVQGTQIEFHKLLPPEELGGSMGLRQALNLALAECWVMDRIAVAGIANQGTYDLTLLGDWIDPSAINEFYGPLMTTDIPMAPWGGFTPRRDGGAVMMDVAPGISSGAAMQLELTRPADTYIKCGGVWLDQQSGFQHDDDECLLQPTELVEVALAYVWESLAQTTTGAAAARYGKLAEAQRTKANLSKFRGLPHPAERSDHRAGVSSGGPWWSWVK
jgi:hypothetical protein